MAEHLPSAGNRASRILQGDKFENELGFGSADDEDIVVLEASPASGSLFPDQLALNQHAAGTPAIDEDIFSFAEIDQEVLPGHVQDRARFAEIQIVVGSGIDPAARIRRQSSTRCEAAFAADPERESPDLQIVSPESSSGFGSKRLQISNRVGHPPSCP
jgi:hypothetical protein